MKIIHITTNHSLLLSLFVLLMTTLGAVASPWKTIVVTQQGESEKLATVDLQRYIAQVTGTVPTIIDAKKWQAKPVSSVILGTPESNSLLKNLGIKRDALGEQGYYLANKKIKGMQVVVAAGLTSEGATNAVYGLLQEMGYGFYLGSEAIPEKLPSSLRDSPVIRKPVFAVRGVLPWYNFFNSPTTWDPIDHRAFVDQLVRMGANFLGFHTYNSEPFAGYEENGKIKYAGRLLNTQSPTWGTTPVPASDFAFGTDKLYADDYFGAASSLNIKDEYEAIRAEQNIMRDALDYAKKRGLHTCLGFEISEDPLNPEVRTVFLERFNKVLDQYPTLDYVWLWQSETQGAQGFRETYNVHILPSSLNPASPLQNYGLARRDVFRRIVDDAIGEKPFYQDNEGGKAARANEGARLEQFSQLAYRALAHRKNAPKLVISGWGGDQRLLSEEYYDGLDKLLPKDVVFSSLDNIGPRPRIDTIYNELPADRQRWPIPWLENDGDQWHPQPFVHIYESLVKDAHKGGSQGILGIHWRTRDVEENLGYLVQYAWQPGLSAKAFYNDLAHRCYNPAIADEMASIHYDLDKLGQRWVGGRGQVECGYFAWGPGDKDKAEALSVLMNKAIALLPKAGKSSPRLQWLIDEMDWSLKYREAELDAVEASDILARTKDQDPDKARESAQSALEILDNGKLGVALQAYAKRLTTRGEYGVLATINTKAVAAWRDLRKQCMKILGKENVEEASQWSPQPEILLPRLVASIESGQELVLSPIVLGGGPAFAHYRKLGQSKWTTLPLQEDKGWVRKLVLPSSFIVKPGFEIGFSINQDPKQPMAYSPIAVTVMPKQKVVTTPPPVIQPKKTELKVNIVEGKVMPIEVTWNDITDADYYKVYRDGLLIVETAVAMFPDIPTQANGEYVVEAWRDDKVLARSEPAAYKISQQPVSEDFVLQIRTNASGIILEWPAAKSLYLTQYKISRKAKSDTGVGETLGKIWASKTSNNVYWDTPLAGSWEYIVTPLSVSGQEGKPVTTSVDFTPRNDVLPSIDLPLTSKPANASVTDSVIFGDAGAVFAGGYITLPHDDNMNLGKGMTLAFEFKADDVQGMPVLLCHGNFQNDGWFVQILDGKLIIRTPDGDAFGPKITPNQWYTIRFVYNGVKFQLIVNDQVFSQSIDGMQDTPAHRDLIIGGYVIKEPVYAFKGIIRNVRIYNDVVLTSGKPD